MLCSTVTVFRIKTKYVFYIMFWSKKTPYSYISDYCSIWYIKFSQWHAFRLLKKIKNILYTEFWLQVEGEEILWMECHAPLDISAFQQYCWFQPCGIVEVYKKKFVTKPTKKQQSFH